MLWKQIRQRLSYANVMSTLAVFLVLGGGAAVAAQQLGRNSVGTKQLRKNAVTAAKIKKGAVGGAKIKANAITGAKVKPRSLDGSDINLPTLPPVPAAATAASASSVNGQQVYKLSTTLNEGQSDVSVAQVAGFKITASCGVDDADVFVSAPTDVGFVMQAGGVWLEELGANTGSYKTGPPGTSATLRVDEFAGKSVEDANFGTSDFTAATTAGTTVSGVIGYDYDTLGGSVENGCLVYGHLVYG